MVIRLGPGNRDKRFEIRSADTHQLVGRLKGVHPWNFDKWDKTVRVVVPDSAADIATELHLRLDKMIRECSLDNPADIALMEDIPKYAFETKYFDPATNQERVRFSWNVALVRTDEHCDLFDHPEFEPVDFGGEDKDTYEGLTQGEILGSISAERLDAMAKKLGADPVSYVSGYSILDFSKPAVMIRMDEPEEKPGFSTRLLNFGMKVANPKSFIKMDGA